MEQNKEFEQITFENCVSAIIDNSEGKEVPYFSKDKSLTGSPMKSDKTLEFKVQFDNYEFKYISKSDTIVIANNDAKPTFIPIRLGMNSKVGAVPNEPPFLIVERNEFRKRNSKSFQALLKFSSTYIQMKNLEKELDNKDTVKKINKAKI